MPIQNTRTQNMCKMFAHPYQLVKELVCKNFKVVLFSMDDDMIENAIKSISPLFIDETVGCEQGKLLHYV